MKKMVILVAMIVLVLTGSNCGNADLRVETATVTAVTEEVVEVVTEDGNVWEFFGEGFNEGQAVQLLMDGMGTEACEDDQIVLAK